MVKYTIQYNFYVMFMQIFTDLFKIFIRSKPAVDRLKISCIISMIGPIQRSDLTELNLLLMSEDTQTSP